MTLFNLFNIGKTLAVTGEAAHLIRYFKPVMAGSPIFLTVGIAGEIGYLVVMVMMLGTEFKMVTGFFLGMSLMQRFMTTLLPAWKAIDALICIVILMKFALYAK